MTRRFKRTVRSVVLDGVITKEENELLTKVAKEENVSKTEADIYVTRKLKQRKIQLEKGGSWFERNAVTIFNTMMTFAGVAVTAIIKGKK